MSENIIIKYYSSPYGELILADYNGKLCLCDWRYRKMRDTVDRRIKTALQTTFTEGNSALLNECTLQLKQYFLREREIFDVPLLMIGSEFQQQVWQQLIQIPYGESKSYLQLSKDIGNEKAIRAVASANGANALAILIPCHRVIGSDGSLTGYAGGLNTKKKLLELEGAINNKQLSLF